MPKQGYTELVTLDKMLIDFDGHSHSEKKMFPHIQEQPPMFQFVPLPLALSLGTTKKSVLLFLAQSL